MLLSILTLALAALLTEPPRASAQAFNGTCPDYLVYAEEYHGPFSSGRYNLSYQRPPQQCRTFISQDVEDTIERLNKSITDRDLARLFENSYPNTLDTAIKFHGVAANNSAEELTFVITGDINAMWLRDSANQMQSYLPLLQASASSNSIASLYRGVINLQSRYINTSPHCNSFQPPVESGIMPANNTSGSEDTVFPTYDNQTVFECKYELDSLAAFLEISTNYYAATNDLAFFSSFQWIATIQTIMNTATALKIGTYTANGSVNASPYTFTRLTTSGTETLSNSGRGNPVREGTGLIRSAFRPSDDATIFQLFIPANMMFSRYLGSCAAIMQKLGAQLELASEMYILSAQLREAVQKYGVVSDPVHGDMYAYEIDGYGGRNIMDDANIPSLLAAPFFGFLEKNDTVYQNTRDVILSTGNPYFMHGPVLSSVGGPHDGPGL
jgi:meiotically up-regulated gene 157 (Mug157) protein